MDGRARLKQAMRDVGLGAGAAFGLLLLVLRGSVAAAEFAFLAGAVGVLYWMATAPIKRIMTEAGRPRPVIFGWLGLFVLVAALSVRIFAEPLVLVALVVLVGAMLVGISRVVRQSAG